MTELLSPGLSFRETKEGVKHVRKAVSYPTSKVRLNRKIKEYIRIKATLPEEQITCYRSCSGKLIKT